MCHQFLMKFKKYINLPKNILTLLKTQIDKKLNVKRNKRKS